MQSGGTNVGGITGGGRNGMINREGRERGGGGIIELKWQDNAATN